MVSRDFVELFECLHRHEVKAIIVGAHALAFHAKPRYTKDIDILIEPSDDNAKKLLQALDDFGFGKRRPGLTPLGELAVGSRA